MQIITVFQVMIQPLSMTGGGPNDASLSLMLQSYLYAFNYIKAGPSMAVRSDYFSDFNYPDNLLLYIDEKRPRKRGIINVKI